MIITQIRDTYLCLIVGAKDDHKTDHNYYDFSPDNILGGVLHGLLLTSLSMNPGYPNIFEFSIINKNCTTILYIRSIKNKRVRKY